MTEKSIEAVVRELADKEAIRDLVSRYAHCVWQDDIETMIGLFTDDGVMDPEIRKSRHAPILQNEVRVHRQPALCQSRQLFRQQPCRRY